MTTERAPADAIDGAPARMGDSGGGDRNTTGVCPAERSRRSRAAPAPARSPPSPKATPRRPQALRAAHTCTSRSTTLSRRYSWTTRRHTGRGASSPRRLRTAPVAARVPRERSRRQRPDSTVRVELSAGLQPDAVRALPNEPGPVVSHRGRVRNVGHRRAIRAELTGLGPA